MPRDNSARVAIVDYEMGNLFSVARACEHVGLDAIVTGVPSEISAADAVILPGVGAFGDAVDALRRRNIVGVLHQTVQEAKPLIGICLGMQLLMTVSDEFGRHEGLDTIPGEVERFPAHDAQGARVKIPHMGWSRLEPSPGAEREAGGWPSELLDGVPADGFMYFVHSYYARPRDAETVVSTARYGGVRFCSSVQSGTVFGCQFHPERSGTVGLRVYHNLARILGAVTTH